MTPEEINKFVEEYLAHLRWSRLPDRFPTSREEAASFKKHIELTVATNPYNDASDDMFSLVHDSPELAWMFLLRVAELADDPELNLLGCGDLETFAHVNAERFADVIEDAIRSNEKIRKAFESVYIGSDTPAAVGRRWNTALRDSGVSEESIIDWWSDDGSPSKSG